MKNKKIKKLCCILTPLIIIFSIVLCCNIYKCSSFEYSKQPSYAVNSTKDIYVYPGGIPIGIKLNTKGVLVVALCEVETTDGRVVTPAAEADIKVGDDIVKINGRDITNCDDVMADINSSDGNKITLLIERNGQDIDKAVTPVKSSKDSSYKIGLWIRDSTSGVGTLTFYDQNSHKFAALGHPITDVDTGTILSINSGEIVPSSIISIKKGQRGYPGELCGIFTDEENRLGRIKSNTKCGIYGEADNTILNKLKIKPMQVGLNNEVHTGKAKVLTTISGNKVKAYDIEIEKLLSKNEVGAKSMVIRITDKELIKKTGGIVQGMSGSPIVQDNKIVGAVTHVLINKPDTGYAIYIEWMLKEAGMLYNVN